MQPETTTTASATRAVSASASRGVLILGPDGRTMAAGGIAGDCQLASALIAGWHDARRHGKRLYGVEGPGGGVVVVALPTEDATVLVAMQRDGRDPLFEFTGSVEFASDVLSHFLTNPFEALVAVDKEGLLRYLSPVHEKFFRVEPGSGIGRHVTELIEHSRLHDVVKTGKAEVGLLLEMRGVTRVVSRHPIRNQRGEPVGAIGQVMFKGPEQLQALSAELNKLKTEVAYYRRELTDLRNRSYGLEQMVGESAAMRRLKEQIIKVAPLDVPVLLTGESGTGKELAAHAIHKLSSRRDATLVMVNAAALPATLVESELFGYEAGSFTGAERKGRKGKIEQADHGTLFFDEVGDMPAEVQVKLLRVLQDGSFQRVGANETRHSNFRLISASNRDFEGMIAAGTFRLDLFYRIGAVAIRLPALRERVDDIPLLAAVALNHFAGRHGQRPKRLSAEAVAYLKAQRWPGNVRQLMHAVERAAIFSESDLIEPADFGLLESNAAELPSAGVEAMSSTGAYEEIDLSAGAAGPGNMRVSSALVQVEEDLIRKAMLRNHGNKKRVADELGISRSYLYKRLAMMGLGGELKT